MNNFGLQYKVVYRLSNFSFLKDGWPDLAELDKSAENVLYIDPKATLQVLSTLAEQLAR